MSKMFQLREEKFGFKYCFVNCKGNIKTKSVHNIINEIRMLAFKLVFFNFIRKL